MNHLIGKLYFFFLKVNYLILFDLDFVVNMYSSRTVVVLRQGACSSCTVIKYSACSNFSAPRSSSQFVSLIFVFGEAKLPFGVIRW